MDKNYTVSERHTCPYYEIADKYKPIAELILDKIIKHCYMVRALNNERWHSTSGKEFESKMVSVLDRIKKVSYHKAMHDVGPSRKREMHPPLKGPEFYDHSMHFDWKEPIGKGTPDAEIGCLRDCYHQGPNGNWYAPCDYGFYVSLYHPDSQIGQEAYYFGHKSHIVYRPTYHFISEDVDATLRTLCEIFGWEYERQPDGRYSYMY